MIQAQTCDELSHRQAHDWRTHGHTQATTIPEGQNWPWVFKKWICRFLAKTPEISRRCPKQLFHWCRISIYIYMHIYIYIHGRHLFDYRQASNISRTKGQHLKDSRTVLWLFCRIPWNQTSSRGWRCSWSSADRRCSNYIWVIDNFIAY